MSPFSFLRRHPRGELSAYIDGQLAEHEVIRLESHLASCEACSTEAESLRALSTALHDLPELIAPRAFTLTPQQVADAKPAASPVTYRNGSQGLANGLRLASAGLAVALAFAVFIDLSGVGDDSGGGGDDGAQTGVSDLHSSELASAGVDEDAFGDDASLEREGADFTVGGLDSAGESAAAVTAAAAADPNGEGTTAGGDDDSAEGPVSTGAAYQAPLDVDGAGDLGPGATVSVPPDGDDSILDSVTRIEDDSGAEPVETFSSLSQTSSSDDGGVSTLLIVEIALATALVAALIGSFVLTRARKS